MTQWLGLPFDASTHGAELDIVMMMVHLLMFALFIGWGTFFGYTIWRFRKGRQPRAIYEGAQSHASTYLEAVLAGIEVVLLFGFSIPIWASQINTLPDEKDAVVIHVVAQQFTWKHHYAGADGIFGRQEVALVDEQSNPLGLDYKDEHALDDIVTGELHVPINKPVIVKVTSKDVIHGFGIPCLRVKQDAMPGMLVPVTFTAKKIGVFEIACSQLCGLGHSNMKGIVVIETRSEFEKWATEQSASAKEINASGGLF
ncbi:MAG: cytochrome c oxidase subunit II [Candidatus Hydrogenedentota bacterium]